MIQKVIRAEAYENFVTIMHQPGHIDFLHTSPVGGWNVLNFEGDECDYVSFLETMVFKNIEVFKKIATLRTNRILSRKGNRIEVLEAMSVLDPTFVPPEINSNCKWQMNMVEDMVKHVYAIITTSYSEYKLKQYSSILKQLDPR
jgi:hypothetical protein